MQRGTGTLWRIRRTEGPRGDRPAQPITVPLYALQLLALVGAMSGLIAVGVWVAKRFLSR